MVLIIFHYIGHTFTQVSLGELGELGELFMMSDSLLFSSFFSRGVSGNI